MQLQTELGLLALDLEAGDLIELRLQRLHHLELELVNGLLLGIALRHERGAQRGEVGRGVHPRAHDHVHRLLRVRGLGLGRRLGLG